MKIEFDFWFNIKFDLGFYIEFTGLNIEQAYICYSVQLDFGLRLNL